MDQKSNQRDIEVFSIGDKGALSSKIKDFSKAATKALETLRAENQDVCSEVEMKLVLVSKKAMNSNASKLIRFAKTIDKIEKNPDLTIRIFENNPESAEVLAKDGKGISVAVKTIEKIVFRRNKFLSDLFKDSSNRPKAKS